MKFENRQAGYYTVDGVKYPSVTTILKMIAKPALTNWYLYQGAEIQRDHKPKDNSEILKLFNERSEKHMSRGSTAHSFVEAYFTSGIIVNPIEENPYLEAFKKLIKEHEFIPIYPECQVVSKKYGYAGTLDYYGKVDGKLTLVDFKTNKLPRLFDEVELQTSAYLRALKETKVLHAPSFSKIQTRGVCLAQTGEYYMSDPFEDSFKEFMALKKIFDWQQKKRDIKNLN